MTQRGSMFPHPQRLLNGPPDPRLVQGNGRLGAPLGRVDISPKMVDGNLQPIQQVAEAQFIVGVPGVTSFYPTAVSTAMGAGAFSSEIVIQFLESGLIQSLAADVICPREISTPLTPEEARASCGIMVTDGVTNAQIMNSGNGNQPMTLSQLVGGGCDRVYPMVRRVGQNDRWRITFFNFTAALTNMRAQCTLGFLADERSIR